MGNGLPVDQVYGSCVPEHICPAVARLPSGSEHSHHLCDGPKSVTGAHLGPAVTPHPHANTTERESPGRYLKATARYLNLSWSPHSHTNMKTCDETKFLKEEGSLGTALVKLD